MLMKFEKNRTVQTTQNFVLWLSIFDKAMGRLPSFSVLKITLVRHARLKVVPNMVDPISIKENTLLP